MRDCAKKILGAMKARHLTDEDLAGVAGLKLRSWINVRNGSVQSRRAMQLVTNFLQVKIWPNIDITERIVSLPAGTNILLPDDKSVAQFAREAAAIDACEIHATVVTLHAETKLQFVFARAISKTPMESTPSQQR